MIPLPRLPRLTVSALTSLAIAASCAKAEDSPLADRGGDGDAGDNGRGGSSASGGSGGMTGGSAGRGGSTSGGSAGRGGSTSTGGNSGKGGSTNSGGSTSTGGSGAVTYGCDAGAGGAGGEGGASGGAPGEAGAGGAGPGSVFSDDFEDGDAAGWTTSSGRWAVVDDDGNSVAEQTQFDGNTLRVASVTDCWSDVVVEARVKVLDFGGNSTSYSANVFARYVDSETYYVLGINSGSNGQLFIGKAVPGGGFTRIATEGGFGFQDNEDVWFTLRLEVVGTSLRAYLDDSLELEATDSQITSGGIGVGTTHASARFDDVKVTAP